jgi:hypothetical protein
VKINILEMYRLWHMTQEEMPTAEIAIRLGVSIQRLYVYANRHKLPRRPKPCRNIEDPPEDVIIERAAEVRAGWPPGEAERRWVGKRQARVEIRRFVYDGRVGAFAGIDVDH